MKTKPLTLICLSALILSALNAIPSKINYQGLITDGNGSPIVSETNTITTNLYSSALDEAILYSQSFPAVVSNAEGIYSIQIGDDNLQSVLELNTELWLELIINGETLTPRQQINAVPYALLANSANRLLNASDSSISGTLTVSGNAALSETWL